VKSKRKSRFYLSKTYFLFKKIASNTLSQILWKVGTAIISIFLISMLTKYLPIELYGLYSKIYNYLWIFAFLADLWLYTIAIREITRDRDNSEKIVGNILTLRCLLGIWILFLALWIAFILPGYNSQLALFGIGIVSVFTIVSLINSSLLALMQSYMKIEFSLVSNILWKLVNVSFIAYIIFVLFPRWQAGDFSDSFLYILCAGLMWIVLTTLLNYLYARKLVRISFKFDREYIKHIIKISLPYGIALFLSVVYFKIDIILLSILEPTEKADISIALYSLPMKVVEVLMVIWGFYLNSLLPTLTNLFKDGNHRRLTEVLDISFKFLLSFGAIIFIIGSLFREHTVRIIANETYINSEHLYSSADVFPIVLGVLVFYFISLIFIYTLIASENQSKLLRINVIVAIFNIIGNIILIPKYSFVWAGIVTVMSQLLLMWLGYFYTKNIMKFYFDWMFIVKILTVGVSTYILGALLLSSAPIGLYADVFVYGGLLFVWYICAVLSFFKKEILAFRENK